MKRQIRKNTASFVKLLVFIGVPVLASLGITNTAQANLCTKDHVTDRYRDEVRLIDGEDFSPVNPDYRGDAEYSAWVLACNRDRDSDGKRIDKDSHTVDGDAYADDLPPVAIKGKYHHYGHHFKAATIVDLKYRYRLHRTRGEWKVTLPIELVFPDKPLKNRLDITYELAFQLGLMSENGQGNLLCDQSNQRHLSKKKKKELLVDTGYISGTWDGLACRLQRDHILTDGSNLLDHYYRFWRKAIRNGWNRTGFKVDVRFVGHDTISDDLMTAFRKDELTWKIYLTLDPAKRPRYLSGFARVKHIHTGIAGGTIAHEAGHYLGLDDEYILNPKGDKTEWRNCSTQGGDGYLMCSQRYAADESNYHELPGGISNPESAKGIYPWIITRRYSVGKAEFCNGANDCALDEFCAESLFDLERKHCESRRGEGASCSADKQCKQGSVCDGKPIGKCIIESSVAIGGSCLKDAQCGTGSCNKVGQCQCTQDTDCSGNQFCDKGGALGIGRNSCVAHKAPTCKSGWQYESRNLLNKDRCNLTVTHTKPLECKLLGTDKAKNWTGPHAMPGTDECRSTRGKKPKTVKCPNRYQRTTKSGLDSCTRVTVSHETPVCPDGFIYKSLSGKDQCRKD